MLLILYMVLYEPYRLRVRKFELKRGMRVDMVVKNCDVFFTTDDSRFSSGSQMKCGKGNTVAGG